MQKMCNCYGIFFKGQKLKKGDIIEIENENDLGSLKGLFKDMIEDKTEIVLESKKTRRKNK